MDMFELFYNLKAEAKDANVTMREVCLEAEVDPSTPVRWGNRKVEPRASTLNKLRAGLERLKRKKAENANT